MNARGKAGLALGGTLLVGLVLGALLADVAFLWWVGPPPPRRGFVQEMERIIQPLDEAQREAIRPLLEETDAANERIVREANDAMREELSRLIERLEPHLDAAQLERLREFERRPRPRSGGGRGGPPGRPPR